MVPSSPAQSPRIWRLRLQRWVKALYEPRFAMIRPPPRGFPVEKAQIVAIFIFEKQVPQWLSPKEKHRLPSATCGAATMR
jgi:hypothetical protein